MQYENVKCFLIEPNGQARRALRRYASTVTLGEQCPGKYKSFHNAEVFLDIIPFDEKLAGCDYPEVKDKYTGWPVKCDYCPYEFKESDNWQCNVHALYSGKNEKGEDIVTELRDAPPGAMYDAMWFHDYTGWCGVDGKSIHVICPNGHPWHIDGPCSNCTKKGDNEHKCWNRHGTLPDITVNKTPVVGTTTCDAGGGSIQAGDYHGMLENGRFRQC